VVPLLSEEQAAGTGKLNRRFGVRLPVGHEVGELFVDIEIIHVLLGEDDLERVETYIPGVSASHQRSFGAGSDGRRPLQWTPTNGACRFACRVSPGGTLLYDGKATVRRAKVTVTEKACVLTVSVRLEEASADTLEQLGGVLGMLADYQILAATVGGAGAEAGLPTDGLPFGRPVIEHEPGDLVTYNHLGRRGGGVVVSVGGGRTIVRPALVDGPDVVPVDVAATDIVSQLRVCGPRGGTPNDAMQRIVDDAPFATVDDLVVSVLQCQQSGTTVLTEAGWTITDDVRQFAVELALASSPGPEPVVTDTEEELPEEV
jgi:hypothetical protein